MKGTQGPALQSASVQTDSVLDSNIQSESRALRSRIAELEAQVKELSHSQRINGSPPYQDHDTEKNSLSPAPGAHKFLECCNTNPCLLIASEQ